jgi:SsrA-binding protein
MGNDQVKVLARNKKARHDFNIEDTYEAGIVLQGTEVKALRQGKVGLKDSFALVKEGEVWLHNMHISRYKQGNRHNHEPERKRKLLLHKKQIRTLIGKTEREGYTLIPLKIYFKNQLVKVELALAKGKKKHDKRQDLKKKAHQREMERALKDKQVGRVDY